MNISIVLTTVLLLVLVYLHIKRDVIIFQLKLRALRVLLFIALVFLMLNPLFMLMVSEARTLPSYAIWYISLTALVYVLLLTSFGLLFSALRSDSLRKKVAAIIKEAIGQKRMTSELSLFALSPCHSDSILEKVRDGCKEMHDRQQGQVDLKPEQIETLRKLADELKSPYSRITPSKNCIRNLEEQKQIKSIIEEAIEKKKFTDQLKDFADSWSYSFSTHNYCVYNEIRAMEGKTGPNNKLGPAQIDKLKELVRKL